VVHLWQKSIDACKDIIIVEKEKKNFFPHWSNICHIKGKKQGFKVREYQSFALFNIIVNKLT